jgi:cob(I)alamin adenosyltransferase
LENTAAHGLLIVHTGNGKGKTTAALGLALRAIGHDGKVFMAQFLKGRPDTGECLAAARYLSKLTIRQYGRPQYVTAASIQDSDRQLAHEALSEASQAIQSGEYRLVILDEANVAVSLGLFSVQELLSVVSHRPGEVSVVVTGRDAHQDLLSTADLVTEMREIKHPYNSGIPAQAGIEF